MTQKTVQIETQLPTLSTKAMQAFCEDLDGMLGIAISCAESRSDVGPLEELKSCFDKCAVVYSVQAQGTLEGRFHLLIDKAGLFVLSGLIVMLPEDKIIEQSRRGTLDDACKQTDSLREIGNLLVGSWDRLYREQLSGHKHLLQTDTQIANLWDQPEQVLGISPKEPRLRVLWEMTTQEYPPFKCAAVFPVSSVNPAASAEPHSDSNQSPPLESAAEKTKEPASAEPIPQPEPVQKPNRPAEPDVKPPTSQTDSEQPAEQANTEPPGEQDSQASEQTEHPVYDAIQKLTQSERAPDSFGSEPAPQIDCRILNRRARSVMNTELLWLTPNDSVETAMQRMQQQNTRYALVEDEHRLGGILSRGDLNAALSPYLKPAFELYRRPLDDASLQIRIKWFMSRPVHTVDPQTPLWKIMETLCRHGIRALPVQDSSGMVLGLITAFDVFRALTRPETNTEIHSDPDSAGNNPATDSPQAEE